jgi:signal transduction histidine kinase
VIDPDQVMVDAPASHINLTNILVNDDAAPWLVCHETGASNVTELKSIDLAYQNNTLSFEFTAMDYAGPDHAIYEYRMTGIDGNWINSQHHGFARYVNLHPGQYTFEARVVNQNQGTYSPVRSIIILIRTPFYQTSWFRMLVIVFCIFLFVFFFRMYEKRKRKLQQLEFAKRIALESERLRIANDMHDDLGSGLSALSLRAKLLAEQTSQPELRSQMNDFVNSANRLSQVIRETIWTINSKNDTIDNLITRLHQYAMEYFSGPAIRCTVDLMQEQIHTSISGSHRRELYLAYKEALHNVVKHAHATAVNISIDLQDSHLLVIRIRDNGKGFDAAHQSDGLGLSSMLKHMQNIGGQFQIHSDQQGTQITLAYPF